MGSTLFYLLHSAAMSGVTFWLLLAATVSGFLFLASFLGARSKAVPQSDEEKLDQLLQDSGYAYDPQQNIFYSRMDAWQRKYGYCQLYDEGMAPLSMIVDCEPIHFEYGNKKWLIELWKGQYGMTTGCEIGVYTADSPDLDIPNVFTGTFYSSASEEELLPMSLVLKKKNQVLFRRNDKHWWLTGFVLGMFSEPSELIMDATITLKDNDMRNAFIERLVEMGYLRHEIGVVNNTVRFTFSRPRAKQPYTRTELICSVSQRKNRYLCIQYQNMTRGTHNIYEAINKLEKESPELYALVTNFGKTAKIFKVYEIISKYLGKNEI